MLLNNILHQLFVTNHILNIHYCLNYIVNLKLMMQILQLKATLIYILWLFCQKLLKHRLDLMVFLTGHTVNVPLNFHLCCLV